MAIEVIRATAHDLISREREIALHSSPLSRSTARPGASSGERLWQLDSVFSGDDHP
jgi:hypothetical protein